MWLDVATTRMRGKRFGFKTDKVRVRKDSEVEAWKLVSEVENFVTARESRTRLRNTSLTEDQLRDVEAALALLPPGKRLVDVVRNFAITDPGKHADDSILDWRDKFITEKEEVERRQGRTVQNLKVRLMQFIKHGDLQTVADFTPQAVKAFLSREKLGGGKLSARTQNNDWVALHHFGEVLVRLGALSENPVAPVGRVIVGWTPRQIHTPAEVEALLAASLADEPSKGKYTPFFVICCFCGVRPEAEVPI